MGERLVVTNRWEMWLAALAFVAVGLLSHGLRMQNRKLEICRAKVEVLTGVRR